MITDRRGRQIARCLPGEAWSSATRTVTGSQRVGPLARSLQQVWGDGLPPGDLPWDTVAGDSTRLDDDSGASNGLVVQGDGLRLADLAHILALVPAADEARALLPPDLRTRLTQVP